MGYYNRVTKTYDRAKNDAENGRFSAEVALKAACLTNMAIAAEADAEIDRLRAALSAIAGSTPWPDPEMGFNDLARVALSSESKEQS